MMTLQERCQHRMSMMGQHLQQGLESANLLTHTPLRISCVGSVAVAVAGGVGCHIPDVHCTSQCIEVHHRHSSEENLANSKVKSQI